MSAPGTVVNGGTGDYTLEASLVAAAFFLVPLIAWTVSTLRDRARARRSVRAAGASQRRHLTVVRSPDACRACRAVGWHAPGCGLLDRLDAPAVRW